MLKTVLTAASAVALFSTHATVSAAEASTPDFHFDYEVSDSITKQAAGLAAGGSLWEAEWDPDKSRLGDPTQATPKTNHANDTTGHEPLSKVYFSTDSSGVIQDRVFASSRTGVVDKESGRLPLQWSADSSGTDLAWWSPDDDIDWHISRDGEELDVISGNTYRDTSVDRSTNHDYTINGYRSYTDEDGETQEELFNYGVNTPPLDLDAIGLSISDERIQDPDYNTDIAGLAIEPFAIRDTQVSYGSFIPDARIDAPTGCVPLNYDEFSGDDRTFAKDQAGDFHELSNRLQNIAFLSWSGNTPHLDEVQANVGETKAYEDGSEVASATESSEGLTTRLFPEPPVANIEFSQSGGIPLCSILGTAPAPDINAEVNFLLSNDTASANVVGKHDGAPNHEVLFNHFSPSGDFFQGCAYRFERGSFTNLLPPMDVNVDVHVNQTGNWNYDCPVHEKSGLGGS